MVRRVAAWVIIVLSVLFLILSLAGIVAAWVYNEPLTQEALVRLDEIDAELELGESALGRSRLEIQRSLTILDSTETALDQFTQNDPQAFFADVQTTLNDELLPELETARERLITARDTLEDVRVTLFGLNLVPFLQIDIPDQTLTDLIDSAETLEARIGEVGGLAERASLLLDDASELFSGDFDATRASLQGFLIDVTTYEEKISGWRDQLAEVQESLPMWVDRASWILTIFLLWFGLSQVGLFLHGRAILHGENPWEGWR